MYIYSETGRNILSEDYVKHEAISNEVFYLKWYSVSYILTCSDFIIDHSARILRFCTKIYMYNYIPSCLTVSKGFNHVFWPTSESGPRAKKVTHPCSKCIQILSIQATVVVDDYLKRLVPVCSQLLLKGKDFSLGSS